LFRIHLPWQLERLCRQFNNRRVSEIAEVVHIEEEIKEVPAPLPAAYQCPDCLTVYHPEYGDALNGITPGTPFESLPEAYGCPTCGTEKAAMAEIQLSASMHI
jgi:rubredoxin